jgi:hypothetical protein
LIEQHDPVTVRVEKPAVSRFGPASGAAVQEHDRLSLGVSGLFEVELVHLRDPQSTAAVRFDFGVDRHAGRLAASA